MSEPKDNESFFRKVVRFVANPTTDWNELASRPDEARETELEKSELKAMIERKRRNDFVRKREFDMLRRVRREGLTPEQLAALGGSSRLDDSESARGSGTRRASRPGGAVKAKIDAIEQQMVGDSLHASTSRGSLGPPVAPAARAPARPSPMTEPPVLDQPLESLPSMADLFGDDVRTRPPAPRPAARSRPAFPPAPVTMASGLPPLAPLHLDLPPVPGDPPVPPAPSLPPVPSLEVSEVVHDPELDEAVIAFANADFDQCEDALTRLTLPGAARADHAETWLVLFDLFRAIGQQARFENLATDFTHRFGWSPPQWYSLPQLVASAVADDVPRRGADATGFDEVGWVAPEELDVDALARLRSQSLQLPLPWVFDWSAVRRVDAEAATQLSVLCRLWAGQALEMRWIGGDRLLALLQEAAPTGVRDADPAFWLARLDVLRLAHRADQFDETAIDYCVTYEVSPPTWEPARCAVRIDGGDGAPRATRTSPVSMMSDVSTTFFESGLPHHPAVEVSTVELSGQLLGDVGETLKRLTDRLGDATRVVVSCARLIRVDFLAAGDLLNWVLARRAEGRSVQFADAHRLVALFFGAMGISEHAQVQVRKV
jgi:hypothetical protein